MSKKQIIKLVVFLLALLVIVGGVVGIRKNSQEQEKVQEERDQKASEAKVARQHYSKYRLSVQDTAYEEAQKGENIEAKEVAAHNQTYKNLNQLSNEFFQSFFTWEDSESYQDRANQVDGIVTDDVKNNKDLFDDGKDDTGDDYINNTGIQSSFNSAKAYPTSDTNALVRVGYRSWYGDEQENVGDGVRYYDVDFNEKEERITDVKLIFSSDENSSDENE